MSDAVETVSPAKLVTMLYDALVRDLVVAEEAMKCHTAEDVEHCVAAAFAPLLYDLLTGEGDLEAARLSPLPAERIDPL